MLIVYEWSAEKENIEGVYLISEKNKSIIAKTLESSCITCMNWPSNQPLSIIYGTSNGSTKLFSIRTGKSQCLDKYDSCLVSFASCSSGNRVLSAHKDGSIYKIILPSRENRIKITKIIQLCYPAYAMAWGRSICVAGNEQKVVFYNEDGGIIKSFDYSNNQPTCKEFTTASFHSTGDSIILGNFK